MEDILDILRGELASRPAATVRDAAKLLYQSEFGCGHLISDKSTAREWLFRELDQCAATDAPLTEPIGGGFVRLNLSPAGGVLDRETIFRLFLLSSNAPVGTVEGFRAKLRLLYELGFDRGEVDSFLSEYEKAGFPMLSHSEEYRRAYAPAYRVISERLAKFIPLFSAVDRLSRFAGPVVIGIDGMCASGKTTLGSYLQKIYGGNIFHADDYFLRPHMRTKARLSEPGGNMDRERLREEILLPLERCEAVVTRRFDCHTLELEPPVAHEKCRVNVVEGSYCLHPELRDFYTLKIALRTDEKTQLDRITEREPENVDAFKSRWIPLENEYFLKTGLFDSADLVFDT